MNTSTPTIIFSVSRSSASASENESAISLAKSVCKARGIPFFEELGCYKGEREPAFIVQDVADNLKTVRQLASWHEQESLLLIDANRHARLEAPDGALLGALGAFRETRKGLAQQHDSWTEFNGRYWIAA